MRCSVSRNAQFEDFRGSRTGYLVFCGLDLATGPIFEDPTAPLTRSSFEYSLCVISVHLRCVFIVQTWVERSDLPEDVSTTSEGVGAASALPDASSLALDGSLAAEGAVVLGVL